MRTVFEAIRVIDGVGEAPLEPADVVVDGERITAILPHGAPRPPEPPAPDVELSAGPSGPTVIDGRWRTLLPGLIDAHAHYTFDPTEGSLQAIAQRSDEEILRAAAGHAVLALRTGTTTARGAGSIRGLELVLRDRIAAGLVPGPRLLASGLAIGAVDGHGSAFGIEASGPEAMAEATRHVIEAGADVVKAIASEAAMLTTTGHEPGRAVFGRPELSEQELRAMVEVAHGAGRRVMAHAQDSESVLRCVRAGVDSVEHAWFADPSAIRAIAAARIFLVPTLGVTDVNRSLAGLTPVQRERQDLIERRHRASTEAALASGVAIATGTDTGEVGVTADMTWAEIALLHAHGASPMAAIRAGTSAAARLLGIDAETGTIEPGKLADLILVEGDPLVDLSVLSRPSLVMQAGRRVA